MIHLLRNQNVKAVLARGRKDKRRRPHVKQKEIKNVLMPHYSDAMPAMFS